MMKAKTARLISGSILAGVCALAVGCSSNPHKAKDIDTKMEKKANISGNENVGVKDGNLVVQKKVQMNEELRRLQNEVYSLEDRVYGNRKYGSKGLYGTLKACRLRLTSKELGGDGKLMWTEPIDRVTDKEDDFEIGIDEKEKIVGVSEEFLKDRLKRFKGYKRVLQKRQDEYEEKIDICDAAVRSKEYEKKSKAEAKASKDS
ncbi:MAG: hypothetical protein HRT45_15325 [Bdellovibrionales bacterium]|nr:hypothetical protein [Bdellovibrionales bacterium]